MFYLLEGWHTRNHVGRFAFSLLIAHVAMYRYIPTGPDHMQAFMGSEGVTEAFKRAVLTQPIYSQKKEGTCTCIIVVHDSYGFPLAFVSTEKSNEAQHTPISLSYKDPKCYRNDVLAKIIPRILNPSGM